MPTSQAKVPTDAAPRYAKQLLAHLGRKRQVEALEGEPDGGRLVFEHGTGTVRPAGAHLLLVAEAADGESHVPPVRVGRLDAAISDRWRRAPAARWVGRRCPGGCPAAGRPAPARP